MRLENEFSYLELDDQGVKAKRGKERQKRKIYQFSLNHKRLQGYQA